MRKHFVIFIVLLILLNSCTKNGSSGDGIPDPNGTWEVAVIPSGHCQAPAGSKLITVSGGNFSATIMTFTGGGCTRTLSVNGSITKGSLNYIVSGNETISSSCCSGTNGFFAYIDPSTGSGTVASNWGDLRFEKK
ncbi:MAG: hypothetical protein ABIR30_03265 [Chitinophagaceae bacterium]